jgi:hypothetical protein
MRIITLALAASALASCTTAPEPSQRSAGKEAELAQLTAGKVAQRPITCLPYRGSDEMRVIDEETIAYRDGGYRTYVTHMSGRCSNLGSGSTALVTRLYGSTGVCRGDIARVVDTANGITIGSCSFGDFTPYVRPGA